MAYEYGEASDLSKVEVVLGSYSVDHCVLAEIDAQIHGCAKYYKPLNVKGRDPTWLIRAAGWPDFKYQGTDWQQVQGGETTRVQVADKFGLMLYLATISEEKHHLRKKAYEDFLETVDDTDDGIFDLFQEMEWDLRKLHAKLGGAYEFPQSDQDSAPWSPSSALDLPDKTITSFPRKLYRQPFYRRKFDAVRTKFFNLHPSGPKQVSIVAFPDKGDQRTWACPKAGCTATAKQPKEMRSHLTSHEVYKDVAIHLGTIRYNVNKGVVTVDHRAYKVQPDQSNRGKRQTRQEVPASQAKLPKQDQHHDQQLQDHIKKQDAKMDRMIESQTSMMDKFGLMLENQSRLIDLIAAPAVANQTSHISLAQAEEVVKRHEFWKANAVDRQHRP